MKVMAITGFACPPEVWREFLEAFPDVHILSFLQQLEGADNSGDLRSLGRFVAGKLNLLRPDLVIAHDFGVATAVMGLLRATRLDPTYCPRVILFNSALRGLNLFKTRHPIRAQWLSWEQMQSIVQRCGGDCDGRLEAFLPSIRKIYRQVIGAAIIETLKSPFVGRQEPRLIGSSVLIVLSENDPFFPAETVQRMAKDILNSKVVHLRYGHFPYSIDRTELLNCLSSCHFISL